MAATFGGMFVGKKVKRVSPSAACVGTFALHSPGKVRKVFPR